MISPVAWTRSKWDATAGWVRSQPLASTARRLAFELVIVFLGVLAALLAQDAYSARQSKARATKIVEAIIVELDNSIAWSDAFRDSLSGEFAVWQAAYQRGEQPAPIYFRVPGSEHPPSVAWQAALSSSALDVLEPSLVFQIGNFYHERSGFGDRLVRYATATESAFFGHQVQTSSAYDGTTRRLRMPFAAHAEMHQEILTEWRRIDAWAHRLRDTLRAEVTRLKT